jgi:hypothetical protein
MKKFLVLLLVWAIVCPATFASGNDKGEDMIVKIEKGNVPKSIIVRLSNLEKLTTEVVVQDAEGGVWYSEWIRREAGYATKMDLKSVPEGDYLLYVKNDAGVWAQGFNMEANEIAFFHKKSATLDKKSAAVFASYETGEKGKLIAHFTDKGEIGLGILLANLQKQPVTIRIVNMGVGSIYCSYVNDENGYARTLYLADADSGNYFIYVKTHDATILQFFSISPEGELTLGVAQRLEPYLETGLPHDEGVSGN